MLIPRTPPRGIGLAHICKSTKLPKISCVFFLLQGKAFVLVKSHRATQMAHIQAMRFQYQKISLVAQVAQQSKQTTRYCGGKIA